MAAGILLLIGASFRWPGLESFRHVFIEYVGAVWLALLFGLLIGGVIEHFIPEQYIVQVLAHRNKRTILYAVGLGFLSSACSCGVLAIAIQLHKKGAATASIIAFLLASPWANLPLTIILIGFFGLIQTLYIVLSAIVIALATGYVFQWLDKNGLIERNSQGIVDEDYSIWRDVKSRFSSYRWSLAQLGRHARGVWQGAVALGNMVLWWIFIGMALASFAGAYIPSDIFRQYMGDSVLGMFMTLLVATLIEVCSEGTAPLAFELYRQTGALGNALVFLMAGVATDYTEIGLLWANIGRRTALWLPAITVPQILVFGFLANYLF